jgi:hypothetical protein
MASGGGVDTQFGRCFNFWELYLSCARSRGDRDLCRPAFDDYFECLHGHKERQWFKKVNDKIVEREEMKHKGKMNLETTSPSSSKSNSH